MYELLILLIISDEFSFIHSLLDGIRWIGEFDALLTI